MAVIEKMSKARAAKEAKRLAEAKAQEMLGFMQLGLMELSRKEEVARTETAIVRQAHIILSRMVGARSKS